MKQDAFMCAYDICKSKQIPFVIYSGQVTKGCANNDTFWSLINNSKKEGLCLGFVDKNDCEDPHHDQQIFKLLKDQIDNFKWKGYEYVYTLGAKHFINISPQDNDILTRIIKSYKGEEIKYDLAYKGTMRIIIESMLDTLFGSHLFRQESYKKRIGVGVDFHNGDIEYITEACYKNRNTDKFDFNNPYFPFILCPRGVKNALTFLWAILNNGLHNDRYNEQQMQSMDKEYIKSLVDFFDDNKVSFQTARAMYDSFFIVMHWYSIFMEKELYKQMPQE